MNRPNALAAITLAALLSSGCSQRHWVQGTIAELDSVPPGAVAGSFSDAVAREARPLIADEEVTVEVTTESPVLLVDDARAFFELCSVRTQEKRMIRLDIVSKEVENRELSWGEVVDQRDVGILIPAVYLLRSTGEVLADSLTDLKYDDAGLFKSPRFRATLEHELPAAGGYFVLVTSRPERLGTEVRPGFWSFSTLDDLTGDDDVRRLVSPTGKIEMTLTFPE